MSDKIVISRLSQALGAEIFGIDVNNIDDKEFEFIKEAYIRHHMLCFREQTLSARSLVVFSERFGQVLPHDNRAYTLKGEPKILVLSNDIDEHGNQIGVIDAGDTWHSDHQFKNRPANCTILYSLKNPSIGGATDFANMSASYEALPKAVKYLIEGLQGIHSVSKLKNKRVKISGKRENGIDFYKQQESIIRDVEHPLVRTHPETGKKSIYCSPRFTIKIKGMPKKEGDSLLDELINFSLKKEFCYSHNWRDNDLIMWDNRCLNHRASGGYQHPDIRLMYRTTVEGETTS